MYYHLFFNVLPQTLRFYIPFLTSLLILQNEISYPKQYWGHFKTWYFIGGFIYINVLTHSFYLDGSGTVPDGQAGAEGFDCPDDFIVVSGIRLCGYKINDGKLNLDYSQNTPVTGFRLQYTLPFTAVSKLFSPDYYILAFLVKT